MADDPTGNGQPTHRTFAVTLSMSYELPATPEARIDIYGTDDPMECCRIDIDNDPAAFLDYGTDVRVTKVESRG